MLEFISFLNIVVQTVEKDTLLQSTFIISDEGYSKAMSVCSLLLSMKLLFLFKLAEIVKEYPKVVK